MSTIFISFSALQIGVIPIIMLAPPALLDGEWQTDTLPITVVAP